MTAIKSVSTPTIETTRPQGRNPAPASPTTAGHSRSPTQDGALAGLGRKAPQAPGVPRAQARLATLQKLADSKLINDATHYAKAVPLAKELQAHYPDYEKALESQVHAGGLTESAYVGHLQSAQTSLAGVNQVRDKLADLDAGGQGLANVLGNLARSMAPDIADKITGPAIEALGREITVKARSHVLPADPVAAVRVTAATTALDCIKQVQAHSAEGLAPPASTMSNLIQALHDAFA